jgi:hypothetical protein
MHASAKTLISVERYLSTSYRPDCDYADGRLEERNVGERTHGRLQVKIGAYFLAREKEWNTYAVIALRIRVKPTRFAFRMSACSSVILVKKFRPHHPFCASRFCPPKTA